VIHSSDRSRALQHLLGHGASSGPIAVRFSELTSPLRRNMTISPVSHAGIVCTVTVSRAMATGEPTATSHHHRQEKT